MSESTIEIPLFPLRTVIFPGGILPLRIFEPRYLDMVGECLKHESGFGICAICEDSESDKAAEIYRVGTEATIIDFESLPDNMLGITVQGQQKFRILDSYVRPDKLRIGRIEYLAVEPEQVVKHEFKRLAELLRRIFPDVEQYYGEAHMQAMHCNFDDATWVGSRLCEYLPLDLDTKQILLECQEPHERLQILYKALHGIR